MPASPIARADITGLLLAGGRGQRMGGADKGLQLLEGQPLAAHVLQRLAPQVGTLLINANRNPQDYLALGEPWQACVIADAPSTDWPELAGPLAGFHAGLLNCHTAYLLTCPCDTPALPADLAQRLSEALRTSDAKVAMACTRSESGEVRAESVFCLISKELLPQLELALRTGVRKVEQWVASHAHVRVVFDQPGDAPAFANINTPTDLAGFEPVHTQGVQDPAT
ncbi:MAG: hypothetical protein RLZZ271_1692 [Pseudomonadota bacterium]